MPFNTDHLRDTKLAARIISARRAYADCNDVEMARVTKRVLEDSKEGLQHWMNYTDASAIDDASELVVSVVSPQESVIRISSVLKEREEWLRAQGLETSTEMDWDQRGQFIKWCMDRFMAEPSEQARDEANRQK